MTVGYEESASLKHKAYLGDSLFTQHGRKVPVSFSSTIKGNSVHQFDSLEFSFSSFHNPTPCRRTTRISDSVIETNMTMLLSTGEGQTRAPQGSVSYTAGQSIAERLR
jgi:hypothetical protein